MKKTISFTVAVLMIFAFGCKKKEQTPPPSKLKILQSQKWYLHTMKMQVKIISFLHEKAHTVKNEDTDNYIRFKSDMTFIAHPGEMTKEGDTIVTGTYTLKDDVLTLDSESFKKMMEVSKPLFLEHSPSSLFDTSSFSPDFVITELSDNRLILSKSEKVEGGEYPDATLFLNLNFGSSPIKNNP